jgi:hypothetical protein
VDTILTNARRMFDHGRRNREMRTRITLLLTMVAILAMSLVPASASAATESGSTRKWPWSGYWWPMLENGYNLYSNNGPMQKYDQYLQANGQQTGALAWEKRNHFSNNSADSWWGHCHAWASAAILAPEPKAITRSGINFNVNDVKGLTTSLYYEPTYNWGSGVRVDDPKDTTSDAFKDIAPAWMDYLLRYYVGYYKFPFIMDISANHEVWNYPVFAYNRSSTVAANGDENVNMTVWYGDAKWGVTGTRYFYRQYTYTLRPGTLGTWTGDSVLKHPDFAWVPTGKRAASGTNPFITEKNVEAVTGLDV